MNPFKLIKQVWRWLRGEKPPTGPTVDKATQRAIDEFRRRKVRERWSAIHRATFHTQLAAARRKLGALNRQRPRPWRSPANLVRGGR